MVKKIGVILSGCGVFDGAEIHESVLTLLALDELGAQAVCLAPDIKQFKVVNHATSQPAAEIRNVLAESARIARGPITDIATAKADEFDGIIIPGGFGAALNLCSFGVDGANCTVNHDVERLLREIHRQGKPIAALCIAPALLARLFGSEGVQLTIGNDSGTAKALTGMSARHCDCPVTECVIDERLKIITTPAYMLGPGIKEVAIGIRKTVAALLLLAE